MKKTILLIIAFFSISTANVSAGSKYAGLDLVMLDVEDNVNNSSSPRGLAFKFGNIVSPNLKVEGIFAIGLGDDEIWNLSESGTDPFLGTYSGKITGKLELKNIFGVYLVGFSEISSNSDVYVKAGITNFKLDTTVDTTYSSSFLGSGAFSSTISGKETGLSYGFGLNLGISPTSMITLEYNVYPDVDVIDEGEKYTLESTSINIGFKGSFE